METGISSLMVYSNQTGYYSCIINQLLECLFFVVERNQLGMLWKHICDFIVLLLLKKVVSNVVQGNFPQIPEV